MPIRENRAQAICAIASGEVIAMDALNDIPKGVLKSDNSGGVRLGGLICDDQQAVKELGLAEALALRGVRRQRWNIRRNPSTIAIRKLGPLPPEGGSRSRSPRMSSRTY